MDFIHNSKITSNNNGRGQIYYNKNEHPTRKENRSITGETPLVSPKPPPLFILRQSN